MQIKCMLEDTKYKNKPGDLDIGFIQNNMKPVEITVEELAQKLVVGCSFRPAFLNGRGNKDWVSQQLLAIDFDNNTTIDEELNRCRELNILPSFGYTSFSHTENHHKFRLVFCFDTVISDVDIMNNIIEIFKKLFTNADQQTFHLSRLFFGGRKSICEEYNNNVNVDDLLSRYEFILTNLELTNKSNKRRKNSNIKEKSGVNKNNYGKESDMNIYYISNLNVDKLKELILIQRGYLCINNNIYNYISTPSIVEIHNDKDLFSYIYSINLAEFLGVSNPTHFRCILPKHEDKHPSANIFEQNGSNLYKCIGCGFAANIITIVERLAHCTRRQAIDFIKQVYDIKIVNTTWEKEQIEELKYNKMFLKDDSFKNTYPLTHFYIGRESVKDKMFRLYDYFTEVVDEKSQYNGKPLFYGSLDYLGQTLGYKSKDKTNKFIQLLNLLGIIQKMDIEDLPLDVQSKIKKYKKDNDQIKHTNHFICFSLCWDVLHNSEEIAKILKEHNFTKKALSIEYIYRTFGIEMANKLYPQNKTIYSNVLNKKIDRTTSIRSDKRTMYITNVLIDVLDEKGYVLESDLINEIFNRISSDKENEELFLVDITLGKGKDKQVVQRILSKEGIKRQFKKSLNEILEGYDLQRIKANKQLKEKHNVGTNGYPFLILRNN